MKRRFVGRLEFNEPISLNGKKFGFDNPLLNRFFSFFAEDAFFEGLRALEWAGFCFSISSRGMAARALWASLLAFCLEGGHGTSDWGVGWFCFVEEVDGLDGWPGLLEVELTRDWEKRSGIGEFGAFGGRGCRWCC